MLKRCSLMVFVLVLGLISHAWAGENEPKNSEPKPCFINVKLGKHVFRIENRHNTYVTQRSLTENGKDISYDNIKNRRICHEVSDQPVEANNFKFFPTYFREKYDKQLGFGNGFAVNVGAYYFPDYEARDALERFLLPRLRSQNKTLEELPREGGLLRATASGEWYVFADNSVLTPSGNPVAIRCSANRNKDASIPPVWGSCGLGVAWKDNIGFGVSDISELHIPRKEWETFYYDFLSYIENLDITEQNLH